MAENAHELSTRELLIEATSRRLWQEDESDLRILDICKETNLSTSVIYGHFRSRQGLIDASLLHLFSLVTDEILATLEQAAAGPHRTGSFVDTLGELVSDPALEQSTIRQRQMFFRVTATAVSRRAFGPDFCASIATSHRAPMSSTTASSKWGCSVTSSPATSGRCSLRAR